METWKKRVNLVLQDTEANHNKYYQMTQVSDTEFMVEYGRIGRSPSVHVYPMEKWDSIYRQKTRKGYHDVSHSHITVGSVVKTDDHDLGVVVDIVRYTANEPSLVTVVMEHKPSRNINVSALSLGYINPELLTHNAFYPKLVEKYKQMNGILPKQEEAYG